MIDLAAGHKAGLTVENPVLLGVGSVGCGEAIHADLSLDHAGAVVVGPITEGSRAGSHMPRLAETQGAFVLETGQQNRGVRATLREFLPLWKRLRVPVIAHLADSAPDSLARTAAMLAEAACVAGIEIGLARDWNERLLRTLVDVVARAAELPIWLKPTLDRARECSVIAGGAGAHAVVIGAAPDAALFAPGSDDLIKGRLFGPAVFPLMLRALTDARDAVTESNQPLPLIACGGIHTPEQAKQALRAGAMAIQLDSIVWIEPGAPGQIARSLDG